jgi:hypothetical protein
MNHGAFSNQILKCGQGAAGSRSGHGCRLVVKDLTESMLIGGSCMLGPVAGRVGFSGPLPEVPKNFGAIGASSRNSTLFRI